MPKSFTKVQKHIVKKKGKITALNPNSRDSRSLLRAGARDEKVSRLAAVREKANRPYLQRVKFLQERLGEESRGDNKSPLELVEIHKLIQAYIARSDKELEIQRAERRAGRPKSSREELLAKQKEAEEKEYDAGFWLPNLSDAETLVFLREWNGEWVALNGGMKFERVKKDGERQGSIFPPKGNS
jgi:translation machinery-associated protein 16